MEEATQLFAAISFLVIGLSHLFQPRAWVDWFQALAARGTAGVFVDGFLCLNFGAIIVGFHSVYQGPELGLTLIGWSQVLKGALRFVAPTVALRVMRRAAVPERAWFFQVGAAIAFALSGFSFWLRFRQ